MSEEKKDVIEVSTIIVVFIVGFIVGGVVFASMALNRRSNELEKAYKTNLTDWDFRYMERDTTYLGTDFELLFEDEPYTVKLYVDWVRKLIYIEVFKMERLNYD